MLPIQKEAVTPSLAVYLGIALLIGQQLLAVKNSSLKQALTTCLIKDISLSERMNILAPGLYHL